MVPVRLWHRLVRIKLVVETDVQMVGLKGYDRFERIGMGGEPAIGLHHVGAECDGRFHRSLFMLAYR